MVLFSDLDDIELAGDPRMAALVEKIRAYADGPAPRARAELMAVLTEGVAGRRPLVVAPLPVPAPARRRRPLRERLQEGRARVALGAAVLSVGFVSTGAAGALPGPVQTAFSRAAAVVGIEAPETPGASDATPDPDEAAPARPARAADDEHGADDAPSGTRGQTTLPAAPPAEDDGDPRTPHVPGRAGAAGDDNGRATVGDARDRGLGERAQPDPPAARRPEVGGGPPGGAPGPAVPGPPALGDPARPGDVHGRGQADGGEDDEKARGGPPVDGRGIGGAPGVETPAPAGAARPDVLPR